MELSSEGNTVIPTLILGFSALVGSCCYLRACHAQLEQWQLLTLTMLMGALGVAVLQPGQTLKRIESVFSYVFFGSPTRIQVTQKSARHTASAFSGQLLSSTGQMHSVFLSSDPPGFLCHGPISDQAAELIDLAEVEQCQPRDSSQISPYILLVVAGQELVFKAKDIRERDDWIGAIGKGIVKRFTRGIDKPTTNQCPWEHV